MIKYDRLVPENYITQSRDYQYLGHLFDIALNNPKMNIDNMANLPLSKDSDRKLLDLTVRTLGFEPRHEYSTYDLYTVATCFKQIMDIKGTRKSILMACQVLMRAQNIDADVSVTINNRTHTVNILLPDTMTDLVLLEDLLDYILPFGYTYEIVLVAMFREVLTALGYVDKRVVKYGSARQLGSITSLKQEDLNSFNWEFPLTSAFEGVYNKKKGIVVPKKSTEEGKPIYPPSVGVISEGFVWPSSRKDLEDEDLEGNLPESGSK